MNEKEAKNTLTDRQRGSIPTLLACKSLEEACRQARVSKNTFYSWFKEEAFMEEMKWQRGKIVNGALETLKSGVTRAVEVLLKLLDSQNEAFDRLFQEEINAKWFGSRHNRVEWSTNLCRKTEKSRTSISSK